MALKFDALILMEDRPVSWRTAIQILLLSIGDIFFGSTIEFFWKKSKWLTVSNFSSDGMLREALLVQLNNPTTFKESKLFGLCHQEILTEWLLDRKWHTIQIFVQILALKGYGRLTSWWTEYLN